MKRMIKYVVVILFMMAILCGCEEKMKKTDKTAVNLSQKDEIRKFAADLGYVK